MKIKPTPTEAAPLPLNQILAGDCIEVMNSLPAGSIDLIFADPPPITCSSRAIFTAPTIPRSTLSMTTGISSAALPAMTISPANGLPPPAAC
jgi:hypothetical protein